MSTWRHLDEDPALWPVGISYSGGSSSEWLVEAVIRGVLPRPRHLAVFFADTGEEHSWTYQAVDEVEARCRAGGIAFFREQHRIGRLGDQVLSVTKRLAAGDQRARMDNPPLWIAKGDGNKGKLIQRCTQRFKSETLRRMAARWLASTGQRKRIVFWIGFAADEQGRAQKALTKVRWERKDFPAIRLRRTRDQQRDELIGWTGRAPRFSMCVCCPFKTPGRWLATEGRDLARAIEIDEAIRDLDQHGLTDGPAYLSDRLVPVSQLVSHPQAPAADTTPDGCDGGHCFL